MYIDICMYVFSKLTTQKGPNNSKYLMPLVCLYAVWKKHVVLCPQPFQISLGS